MSRAMGTMIKLANRLAARTLVVWLETITAPLGDPADPTDSTFVPRPEWWVLFLNQLVTVFKGSLTVIGSVIIPGGLAALLKGLWNKRKIA